MYINKKYFPGPLHIPAKRAGFETDPSVIRHPHSWASYDTSSFDAHYQSQYYLDRDRKPIYNYYPDAQFSQVIIL